MIRIFSDSTCDLTDELLEKHGITLIPLHICMGDKEHRDRTEVSVADIFKWADANKTTPKTSAASIEDAMTLMKPALDQGDEIIVFTISASISTTFNSIHLAAEELGCEDRVSIIDSKNLSTGIALLVMKTVDMVNAGMDRQSIVSEIEKLIPKVRTSFVVDTLEYLHRGGRCSSVAALFGGVLKLHPKIIVENGAMTATKKYRGKIGAVIMNYVKDMEDELKASLPERIFITHSVDDPAIVNNVRTYLESLGQFKEIIEAPTGGVIASHCGPGTLGVLFIAE